MADENLQKIVHEVIDQNNYSKKEIEELVQVVIFELDKEEYALKITDIREIIKIGEITPIPNTPPFIKGIFNLRGKIVVTIDLEKRFNLNRENQRKPKHIVIVEIGDNNFGIIVDEVREVLRIPINSIKSTPDLVSSKIHADYISGVIVFDKNNNDAASRIIVMLNLEKLLEDKELLELGGAIKENI